MKRFTEPAPSVRLVRANVPEPTDAAIRKSLAPVAADRHATMAQFGQALQTGATAPFPAAQTTSVSAAPAAAAVPERRSRRRVPAGVLTLVLGILIGVGVLFAWRRSHGGSAEPEGKRRVAVLPFENLGDSTTEYFADGVTDAVRGKLSTLPGLQVIASRSSSEYRHTSKSLPEIARELGSDYLLIARIRWAKAADGSSRVEVSPELVEIAPGQPPTTKWQQPFEAAMTDVFKVQTEIAGKVAPALDVALGAGQQQKLIERPTQNLAAYDAFLKGEAAEGLIALTPPTLRSSITYYEQAVALDSGFVEAWAQLSRANSAYYIDATPTPASAELAKRAAERTIALAPSRPESQLALGDYYQYVRLDYAKALAAYAVGLRSAPDNVNLLTAATLAEQSLDRWDDAAKHLARARTLDPRNVRTERRLASSLLRLRRYP